MLLPAHRYFYAARGEDVDAYVHVPALPQAVLFHAEANGGQPRSASHPHHVVVRCLSDATGEGKKQIEVDRRLLRRQKDQLEEELEHVRTHRQLHRERRKDTGAPVVALVGYTNAGKSTLLNRLASANTFAEDKLFATLDPMTRRVRLAGGQEFLVTDTVGFVQRLPTTLVAAFRATLEEVVEADLLVHVVDASSPSMQRQIVAVEQVLEEIGAGGRSVVLALNKVDALPCDVTLQVE